MEYPLISVIIPVYGVELYLDRCIQSVVNQSYSNMEIILIDDGSTDGCPQICDIWAKRDDRIKVIHKKNGGSSSARNAGLDICTGDYISFIDSDDWIETDFYSKAVLFIKKYDAQIAYAGRYDVDAQNMSKKKGLCPTKVEVLSPEEVIKKMLVWDGCDSSVCDKLFSSFLWKKIRFPDGITSEDVAVTYKVVDAASRIVTICEPMYYYFHREGSNTTSSSSAKSMHTIPLADEILQYMNQNHPEIIKEAKYFKFKTLLHWGRMYAIQEKTSQEEKKLYSVSRKWLMRNFLFVFFTCRYISLKDKLWYILIVLSMKKIICRRIG